MKKYVIIAVISVLAFSCKKSKVANCEEPELNCSNVICPASLNSRFEFKLVDKSTGADLVFGDNPRYTTADIKLYSDAAHTNVIPLSADNTNKFFTTSLAVAEMYLVIEDAASYKLSAGFKKVDCCSDRIKKLTVNNEELCSCCGDIISIRID